MESSHYRTWVNSPRGNGSITLRRRENPIRALLRKEFQAQQVNIILAGGLLFVHLGELVALRRWGREYLATHASLGHDFGDGPLALFLAMPLLIGSIAVAEERKLGMFQGTLCLPVSRRIQFTTIDCGSGRALGIAFGGVLPLLVETLSPHTGIAGSTSSLTFLDDIVPME